MNRFLNILAEYHRTVGGVGGVGGNGGAAALCEAPAGEIFGPLSQRASQTDPAAAAGILSEGFSSTVVFHAVAVLLLVCYVLVLYRHPQLLRSLREHIFSPGAGRDEHMKENRNDPLNNFSWGGLVLDVLFFCTAAVRLVDLVAPDAAVALPFAARMLAVPVAAGIFCAIAAYQFTVLSLCGAVTVSRPLTSSLARIKRLCYRMCTVALTPVLLLWVLCPPSGAMAFGTIIAVLLAAIIATFLRETFLLFISKKLSIYHWILYLCTVEAFPLSLVCLVAVRC